MQKPLPVRWLIIQGLTENEHCGIQAYACNTESQEDLYAEVPLVGRLTGIEEVKVEAIAMSKLHNMSCLPYMGHSAAVIFHLIYLS
ncbi:hypothetical protein NM171_003200 [Escherichia coli]|nr:hypothetical protein [Escherichia coli]EJL8176847.1 hypothetical protein [Escherichia coli]HCT7320569.1 hypothetical protein [Escherichia coli]